MHIRRHEALVPDQWDPINRVHCVRGRRRALAGQVGLCLVNLLRFLLLTLAGVKRSLIQRVAVVGLVVRVEPLALSYYEA
jgi:hypothetical protein